MSGDQIAQAYLAEARQQLAQAVGKIRHCVGQLTTEQLWWRPRPEMNSIANLILHVCGNLRQWMVAGVGGEPDIRNRPKEFSEQGPVPKDQLLGRLDDVAREADGALARVTPQQLLEPRRIQGFNTCVLSAIFDSLAHLKGHTQEIIHIARSQLGDSYRFDWQPTTREQGAP